MNSARTEEWMRHRAAVVSAVALAWIVCGGLVGCTTGAPGGAGPAGPAERDVGQEPPGIKNILSNFSLAQGQSVTIVYTTHQAATDITGFYVPVDQAGLETGADQVFDTSLEAGTREDVLFETFDIPLGSYKVGVAGNVGTQPFRLLSIGTITIIGLPVPQWVEPDEDTEVVRGAVVPLRAELGDGENGVQWRVFYVGAGASIEGIPADRLGTQLATGDTNVASVSWNTAGVNPGTYKVGISVTDLDMSIAEAVATGNEESIVTQLNDFEVTVLAAPPEPVPPTITVTQPSQDVTVFRDATVPVAFVGNVLDEDADEERAEISVFHDTNDSYEQDDTETVFAPGLRFDATAATFSSTGLPEGTYWIGAVIDDKRNVPVVAYAPGRVIVERQVKLEVTKPDTALNYWPGDDVEVRWTTNVPENAGTVDVFSRRVVNLEGDLESDERDILTDGSLSTTSTSWTVSQSGTFKIFVRIKLDDGTPAVVKEAPALVTVSTRASMFWVGDLASPGDSDASGGGQPIPPDAPPGGLFAGAVFEGHNFEDNCGSGFMHVQDRTESGLRRGADFNLDGIDDFMILARYGKPEFINPSGIGVGEGYLVRGDTERYAGSYNVNTVSKPGPLGPDGFATKAPLPGMVFTGVETPGDDTFGLLSVTRVSDMDGDAIDELVFSFPRVANAPAPHVPGGTRESFLVRFADTTSNGLGQFEHGGVVIVSSTDPVLQADSCLNPFWPFGDNTIRDQDRTSDIGGARIALEEVGQHFGHFEVCSIVAGGNIVAPEPDDGDMCSGESCWNDDLWEPWEPSECLPDTELIEEARVGCVFNNGIDSDGEWDTLTEPYFGFNLTVGIRLTEALGVPCRGSVFPCPACGDLLNIPYSYTLPPQLWGAATPPITHQDFPTPPATYNHPVCGDPADDLGCSQFTFGIPVPSTAFDNLNPFDVDSCMFRYLPEDTGAGCETDIPTDQAATRTPYIRTPTLIRSGFFRDRLAWPPGVVPDPEETGGNVTWNKPLPPLGARIVGRSMDVDHSVEGEFGFSVTQSGDILIISAPGRDVYDRANVGGNPPGSAPYPVSKPNGYPDVVSLRAGVNPGAGLAYITDKKDLWSLGTPNRLEDGLSPGASGTSQIPPKPHMYLADGGSHTRHPAVRDADGDCVWSSIGRTDLTFDKEFEVVPGGLVAAGRAGDHIRNVLGIPDFNDDGRGDIAIGAPEADPYGNGGQDGAVYVLYRRTRPLEGDYIIDKIALPLTDPERLAGVAITGPQGQNDRFGEVILGGLDFGTNGVPDPDIDFQDTEFLVSSPYADNDRGEVWIIFRQSREDPLTTPANGIDIDQLLIDRKAARIVGGRAGDLFGFNMANAGDINGDGLNDLLVAAPGATPRFDSDPFDADDTPNTEGIDREAPFGEADDIDGPYGLPDGKVDDWDRLKDAGVVYVILGGIDATHWAANANAPMEISIDKLGSPDLRGFIIAGRRGAAHDPTTGLRRYGDHLGGGRASDPDQTNAIAKQHIDPKTGLPRDPWDQGRSFGLAGAGDVDKDGFGDILIGSILADPRIDPDRGEGTRNAGEAYLIYGFSMSK